MENITKISATQESKKRKLRVAAYCRVSTDSEEQLESLDAQKRHYQSYIKSNPEWEYVGIYFDEGKTGTKVEKRKQLLSMLSACERKEIDLIITKSISRFSRNTTDCLELVRKLLKLDVYIHFEKENINTGSMDSELMLSLLASMAEEESRTISQNTKWTIKQNFKNGEYKISCPPYGYDNSNGEMVVNEYEAEIVKKIFRETLLGKSTNAIAMELNRDKIKTKRQNLWSASAVSLIISNDTQMLMTKGYLDKSIYTNTNDRLLTEYSKLQEERDCIIKINEIGYYAESDIKGLIRYLKSVGEIVDFSDEIFEKYIDNIVVVKRDKLKFKFKCGLEIEERV